MAQPSIHPTWRAPAETVASDRPRPSIIVPRRQRLAAGALIATALLGGAAVASAPHFVRSRIEHAVHQQCPTCALSMDRVQVGWSLGSARVTGIRIAHRAARDGATTFRIAEVEVRSSFPSLVVAALRHRVPWVDAVTVHGLSVERTSPDHARQLSLRVGAVDVSPASGWAHVERLVLSVDATSNVHLDAAVPDVRAAFDPSSLGAPVTRVDSVAVTGASVTLIQTHTGERWVDPPPAANAPPWWRGLPALRLGAVNLHDGTFVYGDTNRGQTGRVGFTRLEAHLSPTATRPGLAPQRVELVATGLIAGSGHGRLAVALDPLDGDEDTRIDMALGAQDLSGFEPYTIPAEGLHMHGRIEQATASLHVHDAQRVTGSMRGTYHDLDISVTPSRAHGRVEAAMLNLGIAMEMAPSDMDRAPERQQTAIDVARHAGEPLMGYLWRCVSSTAVRLAHKV